jgi:hypothetical protein
LRPRFPTHVWSYDFVQDHTQDGDPFRILNMIDEFTRECLAVKGARSLTGKQLCWKPWLKYSDGRRKPAVDFEPFSSS